MKRILSVTLLLSLLLLAAGCSSAPEKSQAAAAFEAQAAALGEITLDSRSQIEEAELAYEALTPEEQISAAAGRVALDAARKQLDRLSVFSTEYITVDALATDDSFLYEPPKGKDPEMNQLMGENDRMLFLLLTLNAKDRPLQYNSGRAMVSIGDGDGHCANPLSGESRDETRFFYNYYHDQGTKILHQGETAKVMLTFQVPDQELVPGKELHFMDALIPGMGKLRLFTDDIQHFESPEALAEALDPEGYKKVLTLRDPADAATEQKVHSLLNGHYVSFQANSMDYQISFYAPDQFTLVVTTPNGSKLSSDGSYTVKNGYIFITHYRNGKTIEIEYTLQNGNITLFCEKAFKLV